MFNKYDWVLGWIKDRRSTFQNLNNSEVNKDLFPEEAMGKPQGRKQ